jgi:hypothetical protein
MASEIHVNDIGTQLIITIKDDGSIVDISSATELKIFLKKPDAIIYEKTGSFYTDGTDGKIVYISESGDFNSAGQYKIQAEIVLGGSVYRSSVGTFKVYCNI